MRTAAPMSVSCWFYTTDAAPLLDKAILSIGDGGTTNRFRLLVEGNTPSARGTLRWVCTAGGSTAKAQSTTTISANTWQHACGVEASTTDRRVFLDGGSKGTNTQFQNPSGIAYTRIGRCYTSGDPWNGRIAHMAVWNVALADAEAGTLAAGISPLKVRRSNLIAYWPINGQSPEADLIGAYAMTVNGTLNVMDEPQNMIGDRIIAP